MANIKITEIDETTAGLSSVSSDVVYVPGFVTNVSGKYDETTLVDAFVPTLCTTISEFESCFGTAPATFAESQSYPIGFGSDSITSGNFAEKDSVDLSYVYAKELINLGIPVLYERINGNASDDSRTPLAPSVDDMYDALVGADENGNPTTHDIWQTLKDKGEYAVKYLTTGAYPSFEFSRDSMLMDYSIVSTSMGYVQVDLPALRTAFKSDNLDVELPSRNGSTSLDYEITYTTSTSGGTWKLSKAGEDTNIIVTEVSVGDNNYKLTGQASSGADAVDLGVTYTRTAALTNSTLTINLKLGAAGSIIVAKMLDCASNRGDCVALIDHTNNPKRSLNPVNVKSVYYSISNSSSQYYIQSDAEFGAMFTPWCDYNLPTYTSATMPASFGYLTALAKSIRTNANWLAVAGASRGIVPNFIAMHTGSEVLTNAIADAYQPRNAIAINPITNIKPYGYTIWGNRTLKNNGIEGNLTATSFLNIRNLVSDVKKTVYTAAKRCMFEQNSDILWIKFKSLITPLLDQMVTGYGLSGYKVVKGTTTEKAKLVANIKLYPLYAVEDFDITIYMSDDEIQVS